VKLEIPLRVYTAGGELMAEFGTERRTPVRYDRSPRSSRMLSSPPRTTTFFHEGAIDPLSLLRAAVVDL
ncbi:peptidoglycan synthetase, partial [mine drainage metagenome]